MPLYPRRQCLHCERSFRPQRQTARYCSDNCRILAHQQRRKPLGLGPRDRKRLIQLLRQLLEALER